LFLLLTAHWCGFISLLLYYLISSMLFTFLYAIVNLPEYFHRNKTMASKNDEMRFKILKGPEKNAVMKSKKKMPFVSKHLIIILMNSHYIEYFSYCTIDDTVVAQ